MASRAVITARQERLGAERVRHLASQYACDDAALVDALVAMATERGQGWWEQYRGRVPAGYLDLAELEHHTPHLTNFECVHIPGLLQTEGQVRAIFGASVPKLSEEEFETRVEFRLLYGRPWKGCGTWP